MKIVTVIVKDTVTGSISKYNQRLKSGEQKEHVGLMNGVYVNINIEHNNNIDNHGFSDIQRSLNDIRR